MSQFDDTKELPEGSTADVRLFPLPNLVLFPHALQPLHIHEPRYNRLLEDTLLAVAVTARPINDEEPLAGFQRDQRHMPGAAVIVDALAAIGHEGAEIRRIDRLPWRRNNHDEGKRAERNEGLTAERVSFDHVETVWQLSGRSAAYDADAGFPIGIDHSEVRKAIEASVVH